MFEAITLKPVDTVSQCLFVVTRTEQTTFIDGGLQRGCFLAQCNYYMGSLAVLHQIQDESLETESTTPDVVKGIP